MINKKEVILIQDQNISHKSKDDVSTKKVLSNSNIVITDSLSNNSNDLNNTTITVNTDDVTDITIVDSFHKDILSIAKQLTNFRVELHSKCLESKWN